MSDTENKGLQAEIIAELEKVFKNEPSFDVDILTDKVKDAYREVKARRCYQYTSYSDEKIEKDLYDNYYQSIKKLALYYLNTEGAEFQKSHTENGIARTWESEDDILNGVIAFVKVL